MTRIFSCWQNLYFYHQMKRLFSVIFFFLLLHVGHAQSGVSFQAGLGSMVVDDAQFTQEGEAHYGLRVGGVGRIGGDDSWFIRLGLFYEQYHTLSSDKFNAFDSEDNLHFLKGHVNMALYLIRTDLFKMRLYGGGVVNYLAAIDNRGDLYNLDDFDSATVGVNAGLGLDFWFLTLDLGYEKGFTRFLKRDDSSRSDYYTASVGFFF